MSQRPKVVAQHQRPGVVASRAGAPVAKDLDENITISLSGTFHAGTPVELAITGSGAVRTAEAIIGSTEVSGNQVPNIGTFRFTVVEKDGKYAVSYSIGARIAIVTNTVAGGPNKTKNTSIGFEEILIENVVLCEVGKPVEILKTGNSKLSLSVTKPE